MNDAQAAYDRMIRPIEGRMIRSIWRIVRDSADAEDAMQDALATVWKRWDRVREHPNAQALVLKICIDAAYDLKRGRMRRRRVFRIGEADHDPPDPSPVPDAAALGLEQHEYLMAAIGQLSRQQAAATLMRIVEGLSYREIASVMETSEATARKHVARGRERLKIALSQFNPIDQTGAQT